ncbi:hypothetical protein BIU82_13030 [Arthrobacter sp. SW1]|uniref:heparan-alpha-glucosaminide N-acetyltransferase domain-containing protein n=1 Tax=Arthrobacter sp. SW1 TaxID=1920889 RepID=UPI000877E6FB|nr:heparan-alpha-glucosaminide N-acetyltransferase domain-containing protein [Arthrobacter sp. SW1]OFI36676.1 hypothetical protein BIU82_13030 [Arthrobacter sp. SW1]
MEVPASPLRRRVPSARKASTRLAGIDAARGVALLGMMATHLMPIFGPDRSPTWVGLVFSGRSAALFAVLAGVGLALSSGRQHPPQGGELWAARRGVALRAVVVAVVGLLLGGLEVDIAVILVQYALLFLCTLPFLGLRAPALAAWAGGWMLFSPGVAFLLRPFFLAEEPPLRLGHNPGFEDLGMPGPLLADLLLTGYYPALQWLSYLLLGLAIGRLDLARTAVRLMLLAGGAAMAVAARLLGNAAIFDWGGLAALEASLDSPGFPLESHLRVSLAGIEQSGTLWWLAAAAPHSGTTLDLAHTAGTAAAVVGLCLLLGGVGRSGKAAWLLPLSGAGAMTLTLYTLHVWVVSGFHGKELPAGLTPEGMYLIQALCAVGVGMLFAACRWRGPLEWIAHRATALGRLRSGKIRRGRA